MSRERDERRASLFRLVDEIDGLIEGCGGGSEHGYDDDLRKELEASERDRTKLAAAIELLRQYGQRSAVVRKWLDE